MMVKNLVKKRLVIKKANPKEQSPGEVRKQIKKELVMGMSPGVIKMRRKE